MKIKEFEQISLLHEFKEGNEWRYGHHYEEFFVDGYTDNEDDNYLIQFGASGILLDQTEIDSLEITLLSIDGNKDVDPVLKEHLETRLKELFNQ